LSASKVISFLLIERIAGFESAEILSDDFDSGFSLIPRRRKFAKSEFEIVDSKDERA